MGKLEAAALQGVLAAQQAGTADHLRLGRRQQAAEDAQLPFEIDLDAIAKLPPDEREELIAELSAFQQGLKANPLWTLVPHEGELGWKQREREKAAAAGISVEQLLLERPELRITGSESRGQVEYLELTPRGVYFGAVVAGNRFGKTFIQVLDALIQTLPRDLIPPWLLPFKVLDPEKRDVRVMFAGRDSTNWLPRVLLPKLTGPRALVPAGALWKGDWRHAWNGKDRILRFKDGSWWGVVTYDQTTQAWAGSDVDRFGFDEEPTGEDGRQKYEEAVGRIVDRDGDLRATLTPVEGIGWLADELTDSDDEPRRDDEVHVVGGNIDHNPHISETGREKAKAQWRKRPSTYTARTTGAWVHREGLIFPEFRRTVEKPPPTGDDEPYEGGHLRPDRPLWAPGAPSPRAENGRWLVPVFESIDPGINEEHPFAYSVSFLNTRRSDVYARDDVLETFFAFKAPDLNVEQQCDLIKETRLAFGFRPAFTTIDPAARNRNPETGRKMQEAFRRNGVTTVLGQNDRPLTYDAIRTRLVHVTWVIWASLDPIIGHEMSRYRWRRPSGSSEDAPKPEPVKRNDDLIDTIRYKVIRIPVWRGDRPEPETDTGNIKQDLLRRHIKRLTGKNRVKARTGGVW